MIPSVKTLTALFTREGDEARPKAIKLRRLLDGRTDPEDYPRVAAWVARCYHKPSRTELVLAAADELLETHGVEAVFSPNGYGVNPALSYCNAGDTYSLTLLFRHDLGRWVVSTFGDQVERLERLGIRCD